MCVCVCVRTHVHVHEWRQERKVKRILPCSYWHCAKREREGERERGRERRRGRRRLKMKRESKEGAELLCDYTAEDVYYLCV